MRKGWFYKSFSPLRMFYFSYLRARILAKRPWERPNCFGKKCLWIKLEGINLTYINLLLKGPFIVPKAMYNRIIDACTVEFL